MCLIGTYGTVTKLVVIGEINEKTMVAFSPLFQKIFNFRYIFLLLQEHRTVSSGKTLSLAYLMGNMVYQA